ncbi:hypothetical protein BH23DEI1_BH23DEI1_14120 [soil metagenome]
MNYLDLETNARMRRDDIERDVRAARAATAPTPPNGAARASARSSRSGRMRSGGVATAAIMLVVLLAAALGFEAIAAVRDDHRYPPPGSMVTLIDRDLHLHCSGAGVPTVLLEAGAMASSGSWTHVQRHLSDVTRVCSYDRAGFGWSEPRTGSHTIDDVVADLGALLHAAGEAGPYIVVGHSLGGHYARAFAQVHRPSVAGLVLVDARHPDASTRLPDYETDIAAFASTARLATTLSRFGVTRLLGDAGGSLAGLPATTKSATLARSTTSRYWASVVRELQGLDEIDARIASVPSLDALPLIVLAAGKASAGESDATRRAWLDMQEDLASLSSGASLRVVPGADHISLLHDPEHAREVARHIGGLVQLVGTRRSSRKRQNPASRRAPTAPLPARALRRLPRRRSLIGVPLRCRAASRSGLSGSRRPCRRA